MSAPLRSRLVTGILAASVLCAASLAFGIASLTGAFSARDQASSAVFLGLVLCCGLWIVHLEHRLRGYPSGRITMTLGARSRRYRHSPVTAVVFCVIWLVITVVGTAAAFQLHGNVARSSYVQAHGIRVQAAVLSAPRPLLPSG